MFFGLASYENTSGNQDSQILNIQIFIYEDQWIDLQA